MNFCPRERGVVTAGMTRRRALGLAGAAMMSLVTARRVRAEEAGTIVVCKATMDMDQPYEQQTIEAWELEEFDISPVPAGGCPETCPTDVDEICANRCGDVDVTCGRFASVVACPACPGDAKTTTRETGRKPAQKQRKNAKKKKPARG